MDYIPLEFLDGVAASHQFDLVVFEVTAEFVALDEAIHLHQTRNHLPLAADSLRLALCP